MTLATMAPPSLEGALRAGLHWLYRAGAGHRGRQVPPAVLAVGGCLRPR